MDEFIAEELLAQELGVDRERLRKIRPAAVLVNKNIIQWPVAAAMAAAQQLGIEWEPAPQKNAANGSPDAAATTKEEDLTVTSVPGVSGHHFGNKNVIKARRTNGEIVIVRVVSSKNYLPKTRAGAPMVLRARPAAEGNWWVLVGRDPRWKGVW